MEKAGHFVILRKRFVLASHVLVFSIGVSVGATMPIYHMSINQEIPEPLVRVGEHLCKQWDGLRSVARLDHSRYAFRCRTLAEFPDVPISLEQNRKN